MKKQTALKTIMGISIAGLLFSGYLSYTEMFTGICPIGGSCSSVATIPACVYGFFMYLALLIISIIGIKSKK